MQVARSTAAAEAADNYARCRIALEVMEQGHLPQIVLPLITKAMADAEETLTKLLRERG